MGVDLPLGSSVQKVMNLSTTCTGIFTVNPRISAPPLKKHPTCWQKFKIGKRHSPLSPFHYVCEHVKGGET